MPKALQFVLTLGWTCRDILSKLYHASGDDCQTPSSSFSSIFRNLLILFLRLLVSKDEELSVARTHLPQPIVIYERDATFYPENASGPNSALISPLAKMYAINKEQGEFYKAFLEEMIRGSSEHLSPTKDTSSLEVSAKLQELQIQVNTKQQELQTLHKEAEDLRFSLQKASEKVEALCLSNSLLSVCIQPR